MQKIQHPMTHFKNIIFDLCGPIIKIDINLIDKCLQKHGVTEQQSYLKLFEEGITKRFESNMITPEEFCDEVRRTLNSGISNEHIFEAWNTLIVDYPEENRRLLKKVHKNYKTFILSNSDRVNAVYFENYLNENAGFHFTKECFNEVFFSYSLGSRKPNEDVFRHILDKHNLKIEETLFIDDCEKHCIGAQKIGLQTIWLSNGRKLVDLFDEEGKLL